MTFDKNDPAQIDAAIVAALKSVHQQMLDVTCNEHVDPIQRRANEKVVDEIVTALRVAGFVRCRWCGEWLLVNEAERDMHLDCAADRDKSDAVSDRQLEMIEDWRERCFDEGLVG